jgi:hypothetical protein
VITLSVAVRATASASVAISDIPLFASVAKSSLCNIRFVQSYIKCAIIHALIAQVWGSFPSSVFTFFAQGQKSKLQAPVFAVVTLAYSDCQAV